MKVAVLGSGIIGVSTAWWLSQQGCEVVVVDRGTGPAQETSRANGGQISVSYAEPWANPKMPFKLLKWLLQDDAPLLFRPRLDLRQWRWCLSFLRECLPGRVAPNVRALVAMAEYSRSTLKQLRPSLDFDYRHQEKGIITFYRDAQSLDDSQQMADVMRDMGVDRRIMSVDELVQLEPALASARGQIVGGDYTKDDESGDANQFTCGLAAMAKRAGVEFRFSTQITRLLTAKGRVVGVEVIGSDGAYDSIQADAFVVAMGSFSPTVLQPLGIACPVYPAKGYSATFPVLVPEGAPTVSLTDKDKKLVFSRLGDSLRVAGTAELSGYSRSLNPARCQALLTHVADLFPSALDFDNVHFWSGLRPATASNVPLIGRSSIPNLYLNTGHGTLGWTMGIGSGRALADLVMGHKPEPEFPFLS
ncbi:D-amino acid dehydrogenase [Alcaligenes faecalis]|uniref:D-amino acid dehydrogenase n=1 Tax=Alcaligenes faecalis TaxID=511 RepID=UPI00137BC9A3|nr:D-amino acid dehydrogenase [Alcaligenes faecalis]QHS36840.1 D-amino acid dehydrogenase [Alcaligenes faecalis]